MTMLPRHLLGTLAAMTVVACRNPTEVTLVLTTDTCDAGYSSTGIVVAHPGALDGAAPTAITSNCTAGSIGSLVVVPGPQGDVPFVVTVYTEVEGPSATTDPTTACMADASHCIVASREIGFIANTPLTLPIEMESACLGKKCQPGFTCVEGQCRSEDVDAGACASGGPGCNLDLSVDAGSRDAASHDATVGTHDSGVRDATVSDAPVARDAGHDSGNPCTISGCVETLIANQPHAWGLFVSDAGVLWTIATDGGSVRRAALDGSAPLPIEQDRPVPTGVTADQSHIYWIENAGAGHAMKAGLNGGGAVTLSADPIEAQDAGAGIAVSSHGVYWAGMSNVAAVSLDGGPSTEQRATGVGGVDIATDGTRVFFTTAGGVYQLQLGDAGMLPLPIHPLSQSAGPDGIAVDPSHVYWTDPYDNYVRMVNLDGGAEITLAGPDAGVSGPQGIAVVEGTPYVYWANATGGTVLRISTAGGAHPITIAQGQNEPRRVAVYGNYVYWTNSGDAGAVMRAPLAP